MSMKTKLTEDMKQAMRDRDAMKLNTIRFLLSDLKNWEIDHGEQDDAGIQTLIARQIKQIKDALTDFKAAGRTDLVEAEEAKISVLQSYLPEQMSESELSAVIAEVIATTEPKTMGPVMQAVKAKTAGKADGSMVAQLVKAQLAAL